MDENKCKYHPSEIEAILRSLVVLVDTREQDTARARRRYESFGIPFERKALKFGDYSAKMKTANGEEISLENAVAIERKMNLDELCNCFCQGRERFKREFQRATAAGAHIYLLIENDSLDNAYSGRYRSRMNPKSLTASIFAWCIEFNIVPMFISAERSGQVIHDILYREAKWFLESEVMTE